MKTYILLFLTITTFLNCKAQTRFPQRTVNLSDSFESSFNRQNGDYLRDNENKLNAFEGVWVYDDGNGNKLTLNLRKKEQVLNETRNNNYRFSDLIILTYKLEKNYITIFDNLNENLPNEILPTDEGNFGYFSFYESNYNKLSGSYHDVTYNIVSDCTIKKLETLAGQPEKISLKLYGALRRNDPSFYQGLTEAFSVPNNIELTKL